MDEHKPTRVQQQLGELAGSSMGEIRFRMVAPYRPHKSWNGDFD